MNPQEVPGSEVLGQEMVELVVELTLSCEVIVIGVKDGWDGGTSFVVV
jgi:hypothetical protein